MAIIESLRNLFRPRYITISGGDYGVAVANMDAAQLYRKIGRASCRERVLQGV